MQIQQQVGPGDIGLKLTGALKFAGMLATVQSCVVPQTVEILVHMTGHDRIGSIEAIERLQIGQDQRQASRGQGRTTPA